MKYVVVSVITNKMLIIIYSYVFRIGDKSEMFLDTLSTNVMEDCTKIILSYY